MSIFIDWICSSDVCLSNSLDPAKVKGKIVACTLGPDLVSQVNEVKRAGGIGVVIVNDELTGDERFGYPFNLTTIDISYDDGKDLYKYLTSNK